MRYAVKREGAACIVVARSAGAMQGKADPSNAGYRDVQFSTSGPLALGSSKVELDARLGTGDDASGEVRAGGRVRLKPLTSLGVVQMVWRTRLVRCLDRCWTMRRVARRQVVVGMIRMDGMPGANLVTWSVDLMPSVTLCGGSYLAVMVALGLNCSDGIKWISMCSSCDTFETQEGITCYY